MSLDDYKVVLYRNRPDGWVAEVPAIRGCYALMPTREEALAELGSVFEMIAAEYGEKGLSLPADSSKGVAEGLVPWIHQCVCCACA
ncbi:MAG: type II toxin-antitoxin system HicB family antitoxin [Bryobacteraceae bacterium]|jgi:predicted RNase H-like HicB family nuclease